MFRAAETGQGYIVFLGGDKFLKYFLSAVTTVTGTGNAGLFNMPL